MPGDRRAFGLRINLRNEEFSWSNWGRGGCSGVWWEMGHDHKVFGE